ncbi:DJ-1/PfpI family protein [Streptoalloteichus hindustanus]|uniref:DJ-1/PfpI family protein n=1 Tax=Streptoalloteichus hindustanus TaxID=2017 RepID=A0A1M5DI53_STRHI|nr:DJ-1/PfpI family protein [Streptoalloteichus hindustanus]SHF66551.1 DJ-1/PfpI family protein [Streptoalloteichus hindustanus]
MLAQLVLFDGFDPLDVVAPYEVLAASGVMTVELVSAEGEREVPSGVGALSLRATARLEPQRADLVVVPGAAGTPEDGIANIPAVFEKALATNLSPLLREACQRPGLTVATVCGGSLLLAAAGLITGRHATTHHLGLRALAESGAHVVAARVVDDGDLVTGGAVTSGLDVALHLLEREVGPKVAHSVERLFDYERRGVVWRDRGPEPVLPA